MALAEALWPSRIAGIAFVVSGGIALLIGLAISSASRASIRYLQR